VFDWKFFNGLLWGYLPKLQVKSSNRLILMSEDIHMYTQNQLDLIKRFFAAVGIIREKELIADTAMAKTVLHNLVTTDAVKSDEIPDLDADSQAYAIAVFNALEKYQKKDSLAKKITQPIGIVLLAAAIVEIFRAKWAIGIGLFVGFLAVPTILYMLILSVLAPGFSPLRLGLTHTECQFALDEIVGHKRWHC
jgi:hypothetical protein